MTAPQSAAAYRQSLETRLRQQAEADGRDLNWLRRRHVFLRLLHRLAAAEPDRWALKGGVALELRRPGLARATRDLDLVMRDAGSVDPRDPDQIHELLRTALGADIDGDRFDFVLGPPNRLRDAYRRPAWRFHVEARLAGKRFVDTRLDVVIRPEELVGLSEAPPPPGLAAPAGAPERVMVVTDLRQQFAEKLHALTRSYAAGQSSRVKDLVDMVVLLDDGVRVRRAVGRLRADGLRCAGDPRRTRGPFRSANELVRALPTHGARSRRSARRPQPGASTDCDRLGRCARTRYEKGQLMPPRKKVTSTQAVTSQQRLASIIKTARDVMRTDTRAER